MQGNKPVLELKNTEEKVYQKLKWKKNICQCALLHMLMMMMPMMRIIEGDSHTTRGGDMAGSD